MNWMHMLRVLVGRRRLIGAVVGGMLAAGVLVILLLPAKYTSTASLLIDLTQSDPLAGGAAAPSSPGQVTGALSTQIDLITSSHVLLRAVQSLRASGGALGDRAEMWLKATQGRGDYFAWWVDRLREDIIVRPTRESGVISIAVSAEDAVDSARTAQAVMQAYLDTVLELRVEPARRYSAFFDERAAKLRDALAEAQGRLAEHQRRSGIVGGGDRLDIENLRLLELSSQLTALQAVSADSGQREAQARRQSDRVDRMREVSTHPVIIGLQSQFAQQQTRLGDLGSRLGDNHPQVLEARAAVAQTRSRLESESARVAAGLGLASRVDEGRVAQVQQALQAQREKVLRLKSGMDSASLFEREVQAAQRAYDAVLTQASRVQLESQATQANVTVLQRPTPPSQASSPRVGTILAVVTLFAVLLGVVVALLAEQRDARVRGAEDIRQTLRLPLLVSLPPRKSSKALSTSWRQVAGPTGVKA